MLKFARLADLVETSNPVNNDDSSLLNKEISFPARHLVFVLDQSTFPSTNALAICRNGPNDAKDLCEFFYIQCWLGSGEGVSIHKSPGCAIWMTTVASSRRWRGWHHRSWYFGLLRQTLSGVLPLYC